MNMKYFDYIFINKFSYTFLITYYFQIKFPLGYERDGNELMRPQLNFQVQPLHLQGLAQQVTQNDDYQSTIYSLKKHHQPKVMQQNSQRSAVERENNIVSSASARGEVQSQGTTGLLNIIDQNNFLKENSQVVKPTTSNDTKKSHSRQFVFENTANSMGDASPFRHTQYSVSPSMGGNGTLSTGANIVKNAMGTTQTSVFNKTGDNFMVIRKEPSIVDVNHPSRMSTMNGQTLSQALNGNVVQIQRIKLVPVNDMAAGLLAHQETDFSRIGSKSSPRGGLMSRPGQTSYRGSTNAIQNNQQSRSLFLGATLATQASRFHSTQRSSFIRGTVDENDFNDSPTDTMLMTTNVDKELPLKFKRFRKGPPKPNDPILREQLQTVSVLKRNDLMKVNAKKARDEFIKNKFQRPTQLIAPIDPVDYYKQATQNIALQSSISEVRQKGVLSKNNCTEQMKEPTNSRPYQLVKGVDLLTGGVRDVGQFTSNNRAQAISYFYESNFKPKFQGDFKEGVDRFPNLFNKQKSEFLKFANVNEQTNRIIKTYFNSSSNVRNITSAGMPAAGKPSSPLGGIRR